MNDREMLAAGLRFYTRTGRVPRRDDFRAKNREYWESVLGFKLPPERTVSYRFKGFSNYQKALGFTSNPHAVNLALEDAAIKHVLSVYPEAEVVQANTNAYDLLIGEERVEVKGAILTRRSDNNYLQCTFRLHKRVFSKTVDAVFLVCLDKDYNPIARLEFRKHGLKLLDNKSTLAVYDTILTGGHSIYKPYLVWTAPMNRDLAKLAREPKRSLSLK